MAKTAAERVYRALWEDIRLGVAAPGSSVVEEALAERFGVSRTPVREALRRLAQDGLLERSSRGLIVARLSSRKMHEIYPIVTVLEGLAAREVSCCGDRSVVEVAIRLNDEMRLACGDDVSDRFIDLNGHFHSSIIDHSGNPSLIAALQRFRAMIHHYRVLSLRLPGRMASAVEEHQRLIEALEAGDAQAAEHAMRQHIENSRAILAATFKVLDLHSHHVEFGPGG